MNNLYGSAVPEEALGQIVSSIKLGYNGSGYELVRQNTAQVLMSSRSLSASTAISVTNHNSRGLIAFMNITSAFPGSGSTTFALKVKMVPPNATASAVTIAATAPRSTSGMVTLVVYPGVTIGSASGASTLTTYSGFPLPRDIQVVASASLGATSNTVVMSLGMFLIR